MKNLLKNNWLKILVGAIFIIFVGGIFYLFMPRASKIVNNPHETISGELTNEEINEISKSIVSVMCSIDFNGDGYIQKDENVYGSGTYIHRSLIDGKKSRESFNYLDGYVLTNGHVAELEPIIDFDPNLCEVSLSGSSLKDWIGAFFYDKNTHFLNDTLDIALLKTKMYSGGTPVKYSIDDETLKEHLLKNYSFCPKDKIIGSRVYIFGYPITGGEYKKLLSSDILVRNLIVSTGIISGVDSHENYYTDAKIDSGSSGGLAVSKINNEICIVGIPTWVSGGEFETLGMIQPFWKVLNAFKIIEL
jgi:hypothetical protein